MKRRLTTGQCPSALTVFDNEVTWSGIPQPMVLIIAISAALVRHFFSTATFRLVRHSTSVALAKLLNVLSSNRSSSGHTILPKFLISSRLRILLDGD